MEVVAEEESRPCGATVWSGFLRGEFNSESSFCCSSAPGMGFLAAMPLGVGGGGECCRCDLKDALSLPSLLCVCMCACWVYG